MWSGASRTCSAAGTSRQLFWWQSVGGTDIGHKPNFKRTYRNFLRNQGQQSRHRHHARDGGEDGIGPGGCWSRCSSRTALDNEAQALGLPPHSDRGAEYLRSVSPPSTAALGQFDRRRPSPKSFGTRANVAQEQLRGRDAPEFDARPNSLRPIETQLRGFPPPICRRSINTSSGKARRRFCELLTPDQAGDVPAPSDAVLAAYRRGLHAGKYSTPEYREATAIMPHDHATNRCDGSRPPSPTPRSNRLMTRKKPPMSCRKSAMCSRSSSRPRPKPGPRARDPDPAPS